jgi:hypothetical protein
MLAPLQNTGEWISLFNGRNYEGMTFYIATGPERTFDVKDGCLWLKAPLAGYAYTRKKYSNYELEYEWRYERPADLVDDASFTGNTGVLLHISRIMKNWPKCVEIDGKYLDEGKIIFHSKVVGTSQDYESERRSAMKPVGQWNQMRIISNNGTIQVRFNGKLVAEGTTELKEGNIGFQAQGADVLYRNIRIRELK